MSDMTLADALAEVQALRDAVSGRTFTVDEGREWKARAEAAEARLAEVEAERDRLREAIKEATDPDFIWGALDNVHDADTTLDDYAAAVSRAQRAALAAAKGDAP